MQTPTEDDRKPDNRAGCAGADGSALSGLENCPLHRRTPFGMTNVSMTQFSIARYSMGCTLNGDHYVYVPQTDELIRADVLKWKKKHEKGKPNIPVSNAGANTET
jgi:hypothetical protein